MPVHFLDRVHRPASGPVAVGIVLEVSLEDGFDHDLGGSLNHTITNGRKPKLIAAGWADGSVKARLMQIRYWARDIGIADERRGLIVNRAGDYTSKLATIRAISRNSSLPLVIVEDLEWAFGIVLDSTTTVEDGADRFMSGSPFEALCKAIVEAVRQCKDPKGSKNAELLRKAGVSQAEPRLYDAALSRLIDGTGELKNGGKPGGKGGKGGRYSLTNTTPV